MIRAFITPWSQNGKEIDNPIKVYCDNPPSNPILFIFNCYYPDADLNGLPDKSRVLIVCIADPGETRLEQLKNLIGVDMIPPYPFNTPIASIPQNVQDAIKAKWTGYGFPLSVFAGIQVYGDFCRKIAQYFSAGKQIQQDLVGQDAAWG